MYHAFVRRKIIANFEGLGAAASGEKDEGLAPDVEHVFAGESAIGGRRHSAQDFQAWAARVYRLFPDLRFTVRHVVVNGGPWDTRVAVEWHSEATTATGEPYRQRRHALHPAAAWQDRQPARLPGHGPPRAHAQSHGGQGLRGGGRPPDRRVKRPGRDPIRFGG